MLNNNMLTVDHFERLIQEKQILFFLYGHEIIVIKSSTFRRR